MKIKRDAFLYMDPKGDKSKFAQCGTCMMFTGSTCTIIGPDVKITAEMSCNLYVHGKPMPEEKGHEMKLVTPEEAGLVDRKVRCENCEYGDASRLKCVLFEKLNKELSESFDLDPNIKAQGCCNAQVPRGETKTAYKLVSELLLKRTSHG